MNEMSVSPTAYNSQSTMYAQQPSLSSYTPMYSTTASSDITLHPVSLSAYHQANIPSHSLPAHLARTVSSTHTSSHDFPTTPDVSLITPPIASAVIARFLAATLERVGFQSAEPAAVLLFENEVVEFLEQLFGRAKQFAEHSSRTIPSPYDLLAACDEQDISVHDLHKEQRRAARIAAAASNSASAPAFSSISAPQSKKRKRAHNPPSFTMPPPHPPSPDLLPSDEEGAPLMIPVTLRSLPSHLPTLPPKHTYLRTPVQSSTSKPPSRHAYASSSSSHTTHTLEHKLETASLVQESLKSLLQATEDNTDKEDGELFGGTVNWEMGKWGWGSGTGEGGGEGYGVKKRWKVGGGR